MKKVDQFQLIKEVSSALQFFGVLNIQEMQDKLELRDIFVPTAELEAALKTDTARKFFRIKKSDVENYWRL